MKYTETNIIDKDYSTITFDQLTKHLNLDEDLVDVEYLESILKASIDWIETRINSFITPTTVSYFINEFTGEKIDLEHKGVTAINSLKVNGTNYTDFRLVKKYTSSFIVLNQPINTDSIIEINYSAGTAPESNFIQAALINASDLYDVDRSNYSAGLVNNRTVMRLLNLE